ncbi:MAG: glycosyltransferase, partial [Alphaproteobacteria bacterium]|nr:glycosyltransferase [Alphaproteobacteria bacterium]
RAKLELTLAGWPGVYCFESLALRRLSTIAVSEFFVRRAVQLVAEPDGLRRLFAAASRLKLSGFGALPAGALPNLAAPAPAPDGLPCAGVEAEVQEVRWDEIFACADRRDQISEHAPSIAADTFAKNKTLVALYADAEEGAAGVRPKPCWDRIRAQHWDFASLPVFFRNAVYRGTGDPRLRLRELASEFGPGSIGRIPLPLVRRAAPLKPLWQHEPVSATPVPAPLVSVVIPTKYRIGLLDLCLRGLVEVTDYPSMQVIVVDNGSQDERLPAVLEYAAQRLDLQVLRRPEPFNFSRLVNAGAAAAHGRYLLLLNDDVRPLRADWLARMVCSVQDPTVGAVGARLVYASGDIQHAGVALGLGGTCGHLWRGLPGPQAELDPEISSVGARSAVTAACLLTPLSLYKDLGGFNEADYPVTLNDIDYCLRLGERGLDVVYRGDAVLLHDESQSRKADDTIEKRRRRAREAQAFRRRWGGRISRDPYFSPAYDPTLDTGAVRVAFPLAG